MGLHDVGPVAGGPWRYGTASAVIYPEGSVPPWFPDDRPMYFGGATPYVTGVYDVAMLWNSTSGRWEWNPTLALAQTLGWDFTNTQADLYTGANLAIRILNSGAVAIGTINATNINFTGNLSDGTATWAGATQIINGMASITSTTLTDGTATLTGGNLTGMGNIIPAGDNVSDLGSVLLSWKDLYVSGVIKSNDTLLIIQGGSATGNYLYLQANSVDTYPRVRMNGNSHFNLYVSAGNTFNFYEAGGIFFQINKTNIIFTTDATVGSPWVNNYQTVSSGFHDTIFDSDLLTTGGKRVLGGAASDKEWWKIIKHATNTESCQIIADGSGGFGTVALPTRAYGDGDTGHSELKDDELTTSTGAVEAETITAVKLNHSNAALTKIAGITLGTDTIYAVTAEIIGRLRDGPPTTEYRYKKIEVTCTHLNGAAAAIGAISVTHDDGNGASAGWTMTLVANGDDIEVQCTTGVAESCDWHATIRYRRLASLA